jgi:hypothetical protein
MIKKVLQDSVREKGTTVFCSRGSTTLSITTFSITTISIMTLSVMVESCYALSFMLIVVYADCRKFALWAECHYAECRYAECRGAVLAPQLRVSHWKFSMAQSYIYNEAPKKAESRALVILQDVHKRFVRSFNSACIGS